MISNFVFRFYILYHISMGHVFRTLQFSSDGQVAFEFWLIDLTWFYGISTIIGHLIPNPVFTYISNMICKHFLNIQLNDRTGLFLTIQFSISQQRWP